MKQRTLVLEPAMRAELEAIRNRDPKAYRRERAAALLKIADGMAPYAVARHGLLRVRDPDTVYAWLDAFLQRGLEALNQPARRRRFSPL